MKVKLDENMPRSASQVLIAAGHDVDTVVDENLAGATDPRVVAAAAAVGRLLITLDRGLGDIRTYPPGSHAGDPRAGDQRISRSRPWSLRSPRWSPVTT